jgi:N-methylhydantoinase B
MAITTNGGTGARPTKDGLSATAYPSGVKGTPVEIAESMLPLIFWRKELRTDSGGAGTMRGGLGQAIELESTAGLPFELLAAFDRIDHPPRGRDGGADGSAGSVSLGSGLQMRGKGIQTIPPGERLVIMTPGGAGIGDPTRRSPSQIAEDVRDGMVSAEAAANDYRLPPQAAE